MLSQEEFICLTAEILRKARQNSGFTLEKLAECSYTDYSTVNLIQNGKQNPKFYTIYKLLFAVGIDIIDILNNKNNEMTEKRVYILNKLANLDDSELEVIDDFLNRFVLAKR